MLFTTGNALTGLAYSPDTQTIAASTGAGTGIYAADGTPLQMGFGTGSADNGAGPSGTWWLMQASGAAATKYDNNGNPLASAGLTNGTVALGRQLTVGGTNYLMCAAGGTVYAANVIYTGPYQNLTPLCSYAGNVTGGDWCLRPNGQSLADTLIALNTGNTVQILYPDGVLYASVNALTAGYGICTDCAFMGTNSILAAQNKNPALSSVVRYDFTVPAAVDAAVSVSRTNGAVAVNWSGRWLQGSSNLLAWQTLTNAPQPYVTAATNAPRFFRAVK